MESCLCSPLYEDNQNSLFDGITYGVILEIDNDQLIGLLSDA